MSRLNLNSCPFKLWLSDAPYKVLCYEIQLEFAHYIIICYYYFFLSYFLNVLCFCGQSCNLERPHYCGVNEFSYALITRLLFSFRLSAILWVIVGVDALQRFVSAFILLTMLIIKRDVCIRFKDISYGWSYYYLFIGGSTI